MFGHARCAALGLVLAVTLGATGCGAGAGQPAGRVTWQGKPVAGADLSFEPEASPEASAYGTSAEDGTYHLDYAKPAGLPAGPCKIVVSRYVLRNGKPLPPGEEGLALMADEKKVKRESYVFRKDIAPGANALDLELTEGTPSAEPEQ